MYVMGQYAQERPPIVVTQRGQAYLGILPVAIPLAKVGVGIVAKIFGGIFGAHAAAVKREQEVLADAIGGMDQSLAAIDSQFGAGKITREQAIAELDAAMTNFDQMVAPIRKMTGTAGQTGDPKAGGACNAACVYTFKYRSTVAERKQRYAQAPAAGIGGGLTQLLPYAAIAALAYGVLV